MNLPFLRIHSLITITLIFVSCTVVIVSSCTIAKQTIPASFKRQATSYSVYGWNKGQMQAQLQFGDYQTTEVKNRWNFDTSALISKCPLKAEEVLGKVFNMQAGTTAPSRQNRYQYTLGNANLAAEIYATGTFDEQQLAYKSNNPWIGKASKTHRYEYGFTAIIVPDNEQCKDPWSVVLINRYDLAADTGRNQLGVPFLEEEGYATDGQETFSLRPVSMEKSISRKRNATGTSANKLLAGYEWQKNGIAVAMMDLANQQIWISNELQPGEKLILASASSVLLLKHMHDRSTNR